LAGVVVADASLLIAHLDRSDLAHDRASALLLTHAGARLVASPLTVAEVLVGPSRSGLVDQAQTALRRLGISITPLESDAPARLASLRARTGLRLPDCCVLLAAEQVLGEVATFDNRLASGCRDLGIGVAG